MVQVGTILLAAKSKSLSLFFHRLGRTHANSSVYVPPRQGWTPGGLSQPLRPAGHDATGPSRPRDNYYEDVDQRFASSSAEQLAQYPPRDPSYAPNPPAAAAPPPSRGAGPRLDPRAGGMGYDGAYDAHTQSGARSPAAESDGTDFTSVSQRGINPRWPGDPMPTRRVNQQVAARKNDLLLNSNPDFSLPTGRGGHGLGGSSRGLVADGPYGTG